MYSIIKLRNIIFKNLLKDLEDLASYFFHLILNVWLPLPLDMLIDLLDCSATHQENQEQAPK